MFIEKRKFKNSKGLTLSALYEGEDKRAPLVILCHGYASSKDSNSTKSLAQKLVKAGLCIFRFDFTGCGDSEGILEYDLTPMVGLDDLKSAVKQIGKKSFALYGSSFGGYVALLYSERKNSGFQVFDRESQVFDSETQTRGTESAPDKANLERGRENQGRKNVGIYSSKHQILAVGLKSPVSDFVQVIKNRPLGRTVKFYEEVKRINLYSDAKQINCPFLIIHGDKDDVVPISQSVKLMKALGSKIKRLEVIKDADHDIRGEDLEKATALIANFFKQTLL